MHTLKTITQIASLCQVFIISKLLVMDSH